MRNFKSGTYISQGSYKSFHPNPINKIWTIDDMEVISLLSKADRMIGRLDMFSNHIPDIDMFISMHILKEATQSTKIEGTQTNIQEAALEKEDVPLDKRDDWAEVQNYIEAINIAIERLKTLPLSSRLIILELFVLQFCKSNGCKNRTDVKLRRIGARCRYRPQDSQKLDVCA